MAILKVNGEAVEQFYDPSIPEEALKVFLSENYGDDVDYEIVLVGQELKHYGVEFDGVLCSATERDQNGLIGAKIWIEAGGSTMFRFENGSQLKLTPQNFEDFSKVWMPFRQSFFE